MNVREDDVVLCRVKKIEGTTVFLSIEDSDLEGSMVLSEVAAGRIRNLRQYVSPNRLIVCKVLKITHSHVELSLRRVTTREKEEVLEGRKKERAFKSVLKVVGESPDKVVEKIKGEYSIFDFLLELRENPSLLEKFVGKDNVKKVYEMISEKEEKDKVVERKLILKSDSEQGLRDIKEILNFKDVEIHYLGSSKFSVATKGKDFKEAEGKMNEILKEIEKRVKDKKAELEIKKEK